MAAPQINGIPRPLPGPVQKFPIPSTKLYSHKHTGSTRYLSGVSGVFHQAHPSYPSYRKGDTTGVQRKYAMYRQIYYYYTRWILCCWAVIRSTQQRRLVLCVITDVCDPSKPQGDPVPRCSANSPPFVVPWRSNTLN